MTIRVLTYENVEQLYQEDSLFLQWNDALHITATTSLRRGIQEHLSQGAEWIKAPILTFGQILNKIGDSDWYWYSSKTQLKQFSVISRKLRELAESGQISDEKVFNSMSKNKQVLLRTLRMLTEANETSEKVRKKLKSNVSIEEELALSIWETLQKDESFNAYKNWFRKFEGIKENPRDSILDFADLVSEILVDIYNEENDLERQVSNLKPIEKNISPIDLKEFIEKTTKHVLRDRKIVLHGFYFITPIQQQVINALSEAGYDIIHLINYHENYPNVFGAVEKFLDKKKREFQSVSDSPAYMNKIAQKFLHVCEGDFELDISEMGGKYYEFNHMYQFKEYVGNEIHTDKEIQDYLISPRAREVRTQVEDMSSMKPIKLKDYPIGRLLIDLHALNITTFNEKNKQFNDREELEVDNLIRIFASGFLKSNGISTTVLVQDLKKLEERLSPQTTFDGWTCEIRRIRRDKVLIENALTPDGVDVTADNEIYLYKNRLLSYFDVSLERLDMILEALESVRDIYNIIFTDTTIEVESYVTHLNEYLKENIISQIEREDEIEIAEQLLRKLDDMNKSDFNHFDRQDLIQGLRFFLSEELDDTDNSLFGESLLDSKIVSLQDGDFLPFADNQSVHLSFLDNKALPLSQNLVTWPFNDDSMELLYTSSLMRLIQNRKKYDAAITKYLLYLIMTNATNLKFSIVANLGEEKNLKQSFYLDLLEIKKVNPSAKDNSTPLNRLSTGYSQRTIDFTKRKCSVLLDETKKVCNKRMTLSYLLQQSPSFDNEYQHRFLFEKYISQLNALSKKNGNYLSKAEVREMISDWFPHWNETKKKIISANGEVWRYNLRSTELSGVSYADDLTSIALFGKLYRNEEHFANPGSHCKYCPFQNRCREMESKSDE